MLLRLLIFFTIISSQVSYAQQFGKLRGVVSDSTNGEALVFCNIYLDELKTGTSTDKRGMFLINQIPPNIKFTVLISYVGYQTKTIVFEVQPNELKDIEINLEPLSIELSAVEKIGERYVEKNVTDFLKVFS